MRAELNITELSPGGEGVGHLDIKGERRAVFVPGVIAGERVDVDIDPKPRPARGALLRVLSPSADRAIPPCAHLERCGGCDWMHLTPSAQAAAHASIVSKLLGVAVIAHAAPKSLGYRTRARVHVEAKKRVVAGMFARKSHEPAAVPECVVLDPAIDRARLALESYLGGARGRGDAQIALGHGRKPVIDLRWHGDLPADVFRRCEAAVQSGELGGARIFAGEVTVPATIGDPTPVLKGADGVPLELAPGGFSQATEEGNALLAQRVAALASGDGPAVELYAGAGNLTVLLAKERELTAVESSKEACAAARANLAARGLAAKVVEADAATFAIPKAARLLVLDPPREGARAVASTLGGTTGVPPAKTKLSRIVYVSCDPPTLARDVKLLAGAGWKIATAETFEMFPHTSHVETVVSLVKE